jgi:hypothetical protein
VPNAERPWLYQWIGRAGNPRGESERLFPADASSRLSSSGFWALVPRQVYDPVNRKVSVVLKPMGLYALSTSYRRATHFPLVPMLR